MGKWCVSSWDFLKLLLSQSMQDQTKVYSKLDMQFIVNVPTNFVVNVCV